MWPATGPEEHIHAAAARPTVTEELADLPPGRKVYTVSKWFMRDLPYDWTVCADWSPLMLLYMLSAFRLIV